MFLISFDSEEDLESILEERPWLFHKQLVIFNRLMEHTVRSKIRPTISLFWLKVGPCPPECDRKELMHAIGSTFGGVIRFEIKGEFSRIRVMMDVQKPPRRGIFVLTGS